MSKPGKVQTIAIIYLIDAFLNIGWGLTIMVGLLSSIVGILCLPLGLYPIALGIVELYFAIKLLADPVNLRRAPQFVSVLQMTTLVVADPFGLIFGVITLFLYNDSSVRDYFDHTTALARWEPVV